MVESKVRKSAFLREAVRAVEMEGDVLTSRYEYLLSRPELHESHDVLTIRAVRIESPALMSLQAFVKPHGYFFLFRTVGDTPELLPPLAWVATHPLIDSLHSELTIVETLAVP